MPGEFISIPTKERPPGAIIAQGPGKKEGGKTEKR